jgi:hypothetical protein
MTYRHHAVAPFSSRQTAMWAEQPVEVKLEIFLISAVDGDGGQGQACGRFAPA